MEKVNGLQAAKTLLEATRYYAPALDVLAWLVRATRRCADAADLRSAAVCSLIRAVLERQQRSSLIYCLAFPKMKTYIQTRPAW